jgi:Proteasome activator pa28 beta subunit
MAQLRQELEEFCKRAFQVKLFIEINIPKIEDGNNFGVAVQENILSQIGRLIDGAIKMTENSFRFWAYRGKLQTKVNSIVRTIRNLFYVAHQVSNGLRV